MNSATGTQQAEAVVAAPAAGRPEDAAVGMSNLVLLGPPGAGKGTVAELLSTRLGIPHISSGEMFRAAIGAGTRLGKQVAATIRRGALVSDQVTVELISERLAAADARRGYLLDGFPRTIPQAEALQALGDVNAAINLAVSDDLAVLRISGRRVCTGGRPLVQRDDDRPAAVRHRLQVYQRQTAPLVEFYAKRGLLLGVDGSLPAVQIRDHILAHLRVRGG